MSLGIADILIILLIVAGPLKPAIVFAALTAKSDAAFKRQVAIKTVVTASIVLLIFILAGEGILGVFHISLAALKLAGGLILLLFALGMVMGEEKKGDAAAAPPSLSIAVYPLAMPLMATPQAIVAIVTMAAAMPKMQGAATLVVLTAVVMAINLVVLVFADKIIAKIGVAALQITARVVGLLLAALAVQLMLWGLGDVGAIPPIDMSK
ncbi:MAG: MarC family protein [Dongiaceae bacterium]